LVWLARSRHQFVIRRRRVWPDLQRNWRFGRWSLASQLVLVARGAAVLWLLALLLDATSTGIFVACDTLVRLAAPLLMAVANVFLPRAARAFAQGDVAEVSRLARRTAAGLGMATALLAVLFICCGEFALAALYGDAYAGHGTVLSLLALAAVADALEIVATTGTMALNRAHAVFTINTMGTVLTLAIAALLVPTFGVVGAAAGSLVGRWVIAIAMWAMFARLTQTDPALKPT
jgi:O-antigen/teichoic acid export membrane protein